ncbi:MAG: tRNA (N6-threonylcarbamoyladenosine(37)-N6)-methyltransferase TrmO [Gammaproteobacteria bacterium]|nr:tRNA (N6-threonylcarbamoyladenosine(37)-N6)-methyltransferase TrmO [Gammaproteobacteria bacterium]
MTIQFETIGIVHSPYKEKFGVPRQPGLVPQAHGSLELLPPYNRAETVIGLEGYSHIWIQFLFDRNPHGEWQPTVRPPRLGGNRRVGVFASRSPFRPNPIGLSVVKLERVALERGGVTLEISGIDLVDGTPVLDIKPYLAYVDSIPEARSGYAESAPVADLEVRFSPLAERQLQQRQGGGALKVLIEGVLASDPRPAYRRSEQHGRVYGVRLHDFDLRWRLDEHGVEVVELASPAR